MLDAYVAAYFKSMEYKEYTERQESIGRPVLALRDWMKKSDELEELHRRHNDREITAAQLDCQATWDLEYLLGA